MFKKMLLLLFISITSMPIGAQTTETVSSQNFTSDFNGNGTVDFPDFLIFATGFGKSNTNAEFNSTLDLDRSGDIGFGDFLIFAQNFGKNVADSNTTSVIGEVIEVDLPNGAKMEFVWIEPGTFMMGSREDEVGRSNSEGPQHKVTISQGFYLGKYEVTQSQWTAVMETSPWTGKDMVRDNPDNPAVHISWYDILSFIDKMNEIAGERLYRLPTEAEWEFSCRAGTTTRWSFGDDESALSNYAWYWDNTSGERYAHTVGTKLANPWGVYDMHGNVLEWCWAKGETYSISEEIDPIGTFVSVARELRGGSFHTVAEGLRSANRHNTLAGYSDSTIGFRLMKTK